MKIEMNTHKQNENQESDQIKWLVENCVRADTIHQTRESASMCVYLSIGLRRGSNCSLLLTINRYRHHYDSTIAVARHWIRYDAPTHIFIPHTCSNPYTHRIRSEKLCHRRQTVCIFLFGHLSYFYIMCTINNTTYAWKVEEIRGGERKPEQKISATFFHFNVLQIACHLILSASSAHSLNEIPYFDWAHLIRLSLSLDTVISSSHS